MDHKTHFVKGMFKESQAVRNEILDLVTHQLLEKAI